MQIRLLTHPNLNETAPQVVKDAHAGLILTVKKFPGENSVTDDMYGVEPGEYLNKLSAQSEEVAQLIKEHFSKIAEIAEYSELKMLFLIPCDCCEVVN